MWSDGVYSLKRLHSSSFSSSSSSSFFCLRFFLFFVISGLAADFVRSARNSSQTSTLHASHLLTSTNHIRM